MSGDKRIKAFLIGDDPFTAPDPRGYERYYGIQEVFDAAVEKARLEAIGVGVWALMENGELVRVGEADPK